MYMGSVDWRRTDSETALSSLPSTAGLDLYLLQISSDADLRRTERLTNGLLNRLFAAVANPVGGVSIESLVSADLSRITENGNEVIVADPPAGGSEFVVVEFDAAGAVVRVVRNPAKNLLRFDYLDQDLVLASLGSPDFIFDGAPIGWTTSASTKLALNGIGEYLWGFDAVVSSGEANPTYLGFGVGPGSALAVFGNASSADLTVGGNAAWSVPVASGFLATMNSENGRVCVDR